MSIQSDVVFPLRFPLNINTPLSTPHKTMYIWSYKKDIYVWNETFRLGPTYRGDAHVKEIFTMISCMRNVQ